MHILFDIGGSKTRVARSDDLETIVGEPVIFPTKDSFDEQLDTLVATAQSLLNGTKAVSVTGGIKGVYDHASGRIGKTPGRDLWTWQPFAERIEAGLGVTPLVHNDTALVGMGEAHSGAGVGSERFAYISVSTGVGGVQIVHGDIVDAVYGFEPGHQIINYATGERLEAMVGGASLKARSGMEPIDIHDEAVWEREAELLAVGLHNSILHWSPDTVVLGGSMMKGIGVEGILIERVHAHVEKNLTIFPKMPEFRLAKLGQFGGLYGAMLVRSRLKMKIDRSYRASTIPPHAKCVFEGVLFDIYQWEQVLYDGSTATFERLIGNDIAKVIAIRADGKIIIVDDEQPARPVLTKIPGGYVDAGETPEEAARRELLEECGYRVGTLTPFIDIAPWNKVDFRRYYYIARGCSYEQESLTQAGERVTVRLVDFDEFITMVASGVLEDQVLTERVLRAQQNPISMSELHTAFSPRSIKNGD